MLLDTKAEKVTLLRCPDGDVVLFNKFAPRHVDLPEHPNSGTNCVVANGGWQATECSERKHVVCQTG